MGLAEWFYGFCNNLAVQNKESISERYQLITRRLNLDFWNTDSRTSHSLYVGSYGRNTAIQGFSDLDMLMRLPYETYKKYDGYSSNGQSALLQAVRQSISTTYSKTSIGGDGQVVCVPFADGITFEVLPAFVNENGSYTYPNSNNGGSWATTNPKPELDAMRTRNDSCNNNLIRLCRMMRAWRGKWDVPIGGLLIDTLAYNFIESWAHKDKSFLYYDYMCRDFFEYLANQKDNQTYWKAPGSGQYVYAKGNFRPKAKKAYNLALEAIEHESATPKREWSAKSKWREVFGTKFPD